MSRQDSYLLSLWISIVGAFIALSYLAYFWSRDVNLSKRGSFLWRKSVICLRVCTMFLNFTEIEMQLQFVKNAHHNQHSVAAQAWDSTSSLYRYIKLSAASPLKAANQKASVLEIPPPQKQLSGKLFSISGEALEFAQGLCSPCSRRTGWCGERW